MKFSVAVASAILHTYFVLGFVGFVTGILKIFQVASLYDTGDPKLVAGAISQEVITFIFAVIPGLLGVYLSWLVLRRWKYKPRWFVALSTIFATAWLFFIPIGTVLGVLMLKWKKTESQTQAAT